MATIPPVPNEELKESRVWREFFYAVVRLNTHREITQYEAPATGVSVTVNDGVNTLIIEPAGTIATHTIVFPSIPLDGHILQITSTQIITTLTCTPPTGQTINGAPATLAANGFARWIYKFATRTWYRIG